MNKQWLFLLGFVLFTFTAACQNTSLEPVTLDDAWKDKIFELAPESATAKVSGKHKVLLFSLFTGYEHWVIPHTDEMIGILAKKTGAFEIVKSTDIAMFEKGKLKEFDAIILNNNCSDREKRDLFYDALKSDASLSEDDRIKKAKELENNLLTYVKKGGGLAVFHGGIVMQNNSPEFSDLLGGSFDYHPRQQDIELEIAEADHPLTRAFEGKSLTHFDEPYFFKNAYAKKNFRPMLYMENKKIDGIRHTPDDDISYVSWIKSHGKGRVFYVSPSHNAQSFEQARLLKYYLNGIQYVLGDLSCDDSPINQ